jgi:membrane protein
MAAYATGEKGEYADRPLAIPRAGWRSVLYRVKSQLGEDNIGILSAGVAFYAFLASFPAIAAVIMIYGLIAEPSQVQEQLAMAKELMPAEAYGILESQSSKLVTEASGTLGFGLVLSLGMALWSASKGVNALLTAVNVAYEERDERGYVSSTAWTLFFTLGAAVFAVLSLIIIAAIPAAVSFLTPDSIVGEAILWARWLVMAVFAIAALALFYNLGPSRRRPQFRWVTPGAVTATVLWVLGSIAFSVYVENFASYNSTFGSLGAVVILLMWLYLSAYIVCVGAELNSELEHQTRRDTTVGPSRPIGSRGAYVADHVPTDV